MRNLALHDVDLTDLDNFASGFPHDIFEMHRRDAPVWWHEPTEHTPDGEGFWSVATHAETVEVLKDPETYSSRTGGSRRYGGTALKDLAVAGEIMSVMDEPRHGQIRRLVARDMSPAAISRLEPELRRRTRDLLAGIEDGAEVDFTSELAGELPLQVICEVLGIPQEDRHELWDAVDSGSDVPMGDALYEPIDERREKKTRLFEYASNLAAAKLACPADDMLSIVVHATLADGDPPKMTDPEIYSFLRHIFGAGSETTRSAIAGGLLALIEHPEQFRALRSHRALMPSAVEEILRWTTPSPSKRRTATRRVSLGGSQIEPGQKVLVWEGSANRDERVFEHPTAFDIRRSPNPHLSFGFGLHFCLGAHLARLEARVMFEELLAAFSDFEVTGPVEWSRGNRVMGLRRLPVSLRRP